MDTCADTNHKMQRRDLWVSFVVASIPTVAKHMYWQEIVAERADSLLREYDKRVEDGRL